MILACLALLVARVLQPLVEAYLVDIAHASCSQQCTMLCWFARCRILHAPCCHKVKDVPEHLQG